MPSGAGANKGGANLKSYPVIRGALGTFVGGFVLYFLFKRVSPAILSVELAEVEWLKLIWAVLFIGLSYVCRAALWKKLLYPFRKYDYGAVFWSTMIGYFTNNILPARLGDVTRGVSLRLMRGGDTGYVFGTLALERIMDVSVLLAVILGISVYRNPQSMWLIRAAVVMGSLVAAFFTVAFLLKWSTRRQSNRIPPFLRTLKERASGFPFLKDIIGFAANVGTSMSIENSLRGVPWLLITWFITFWGLYFTLDSLHLTRQIDLLQVGLILCIASLGLGVPSLPASVGTYQAAFVFGASLVGVGEGRALLASFLYQGLWIVITSILGVVSMIWAGVGLRTILARIRENREKGGALPESLRRWV